MKQSILTIFLFLNLQLGYGQTIYISTWFNEIHELTEDNQLIKLSEINTNGQTILDIAVCPDQKFYGITEDYIAELNIETGQFNPIFEFDETQVDSFEIRNSLTCSNTNELFFINNSTKELFKLNIPNLSLNTIGNFNSSTPGDLTFYKGHLIFPESNFIRAYDIISDTTKTLFCLPSGIGIIYGIANQFSTCDSNRILATNWSGELIEFHFENDSISKSILDTQNQIINGIASTNEFLGSTCNPDIDSNPCAELSTLDSFLNDNEIEVYPNPTSDIINIRTSSTINEVRIINFNGTVIKNFSTYKEYIDISDIKKGIYYINFITSEMIHTRKIIKN